MEACANTLARPTRWAETEPSVASGSCQWSEEETLWLRVLKTPEVNLRPCDWAFLDAQLGRTRGDVRRQLVQLGLSNYGRRYAVNERFFDGWTHESAWVLGLLLSDGHLSRQNPTVHFSSVDRELIEKVRACMQATHPIRMSRGGVGHLGDKPLYLLDVNRRRLRASIDGVVAARLKSERVRVPDVPFEHLRHFVRGYFEGDGSIFFDEPRSNLHVQISGLTAFIESLRERLIDAGVYRTASVYRCPQAQDTSTLNVNGAQAFHLAHFMYRDAPSALVLERKRAVYDRVLQWRRAHGLLPETSNVG